MWFQNRRAKWRKRENTKKGPGRPSHHDQPRSCSGIPLSQEELKQKELKKEERRKRKMQERFMRSKQSNGEDILSPFNFVESSFYNDGENKECGGFNGVIDFRTSLRDNMKVGGFHAASRCPITNSNTNYAEMCIRSNGESTSPSYKLCQVDNTESEEIKVVDDDESVEEMILNDEKNDEKEMKNPRNDKLSQVTPSFMHPANHSLPSMHQKLHYLNCHQLLLRGLLTKNETNVFKKKVDSYQKNAKYFDKDTTGSENEMHDNENNGKIMMGGNNDRVDGNKTNKNIKNEDDDISNEDKNINNKIKTGYIEDNQNYDIYKQNNININKSSRIEFNNLYNNNNKSNTTDTNNSNTTNNTNINTTPNSSNNQNYKASMTKSNVLGFSIVRLLEDKV